MKESGSKKVLVVEDHHDMLMIIRKYLEENQFTVLEAFTAEEGLKVFSREKPDLVLMDLMLPSMNGFEAIKKIKELHSPSKYVPIIIITAKSDVSDIVRGLETGADDYLVKPFHLDELIARVNTSLRIKKLNELFVNQSEELEKANLQITRLNESLLEKNKHLRKNIYNLHSLFEVSMELHAILDLKRLINSTLLTIIGQFACKSTLFIYAMKHNEMRMEVQNSKGFFERDLKNMVLHKSDPLIAALQNRPYPTTVAEMDSTIKASAGLKRLRQLSVEIVTPIVINSFVEGLIGLGPRVRKRAYNEEELEQLSILSNIISIAVANASLYKEVEQLSYTDAMTELHNFRYFELRLKEEVIRHKRTNSGISLLILDVDHFKNFNDTLGHQAGDEVLRKLGKILKETVRENDIVARYGGEEFAVILPAVDTKGALVLAERIREHIEETPFDQEEVQPTGKVTVSIGQASLPENAEDYKDLIYKADTALYAAKNNGRNRVRYFTRDMVE